MMIIIITSLMIMFTVVGSDVGGRGDITVFLSDSNFCRHIAYPDLLFVMFVSLSRKMTKCSIKLDQDGFLFRYLHIIIDYYIWPPYAYFSYSVVR